jgi:hypothetical protein
VSKELWSIPGDGPGALLYLETAAKQEIAPRRQRASDPSFRSPIRRVITTSTTQRVGKTGRLTQVPAGISPSESAPRRSRPINAVFAPAMLEHATSQERP